MSYAYVSVSVVVFCRILIHVLNYGYLVKFSADGILTAYWHQELARLHGHLSIYTGKNHLTAFGDHGYNDITIVIWKPLIDKKHDPFVYTSSQYHWNVVELEKR